MPFINQAIHASRPVAKALQASSEFFRYCEFIEASLEGGDFDGVFVGCTFKHIEWYWGLFNGAILIDCEFEDCSFRGTCFAACRLVKVFSKIAAFCRIILTVIARLGTVICMTAGRKLAQVLTQCSVLPLRRLKPIVFPDIAND